MKKILFTAVFSAICGVANAQALKVLYEITSNNAAELEQLEAIPDEALKEQLKQQLSAPSYYELQTNGIESLFKKSENNASNLENLKENAANVQIMVVENKSTGAYQNYKTKEYLEGIHFFEKDFFIKDQTVDFSWHIGTEEKKIGTFLCKKATAMHNGTPITAWFSEDFPVPAGPDQFNGLPGLILELHDGTETFKALKIEKLPKNTIAKPVEKGEVVSRAKFNEIKNEIVY